MDEFAKMKSDHTRLAVENIRAEQAIRKKERDRIKREIQTGFVPSRLPPDVAHHIASFVRIQLPISQESIDEIEKVFVP